jgi:serine/threonine protein kinase/tetratricopeptide (TPR) repeat protein
VLTPRQGIPAALAERYQLRREIGAGGMAVVYEADDLRHARRVAVKVVRPDVVSAAVIERFQREIAMAAQLSHPHIVPLFDSGVEGTTLFFVMPLIEGETLRDWFGRVPRLPLGDVVRLAEQLGSALQYAHLHGVVHRDVKPENIMCTSGGAMLADFGIARDADRAATGVTTTGGFVGTPRYASPEQLKGTSDTGSATDQYALACLLFEALAGRPPFVAANHADLVVAHVTAPPPALREFRSDASPAMEAALLRAMAKSPEARFPDVAAFAAAFVGAGDAAWTPPPRSRRLVWTAAALVTVTSGLALWGSGALQPLLAPDRVPTVAVLLCRNLSGDPSQDYFGDGVTEQVIAHLSAMPELRVINIQSVLRYRDSDRPAREIGQELDADLLVWCSANRQPREVRIGAQLVDVRSNVSIWSDNYSDDASDILRPQLLAAQSIAEAVSTTIGARDRGPSARPTTSDSAYALYSRGRHAWHLGTFEGLQRSLVLLTAAVEEDSSFALAYAGLADAQLSLVGRWMASPRVHYPAAAAAIARALAFDPDLAAALAARGRLAHRGEWAWARAAEDLRRARRADPSAWQPWLDHAKLETAQGRHAEAIRLAETGMRLDPVNALNVLGRAEILYHARRFPDALVAVDRAIELEPTFGFNHLWRAMILLGMGRAEDAVESAREATRLAARHPGTLAILARAEAEAGRPENARVILLEMERSPAALYVPPTLIAVVHMGLRDLDAAFAALTRAVEERDWFIAELAVHPLADPVREDPRLTPLLERLGLERVRPPVTTTLTPRAD